MPRKLRPDEQELWDKVRQTAIPLRSESPVPPLSQKRKIQNKALNDPIEIPKFQIGSKSKSILAQPKPHQPITMDAKTFGKMTRGKLAPQARIDLHGMTIAQAQPELVRFIMSAAQRQLRLVLVITGKGKSKPSYGPIPERIGVLKHNVPQWLRQAPISQIVMDVAPAHQKHGGGGAYYVYLRRPVKGHNG